MRLDDDRFHRDLIEWSETKLLFESLQRLRDRAYSASRVTMSLRSRPIHSTRDPNAIVERIRIGGPDLAAKFFRLRRE